MLATGIGSPSVVGMGLPGLMLTARLLPAEALGAFLILQVLIVFLSEGSSFGIHAALERYLAGADDRLLQQRILSTAFHFRIATALLTAAVLPASAALMFPILGLEEPSASLVVLLIGWFLLEAVLKLLLSHHQARFDFKAIGSTNVVSSLVNFTVILVLVVALKQGFMGLIYAKLLSRIIAVGYAWIVHPLEVRARFDLPLLRRLLRYCLPLYANYFLAFLSTRADTLLIGWLLGTSAVAYYEIARRIPDSLMLFYEAFRQVYFPFVARSALHNDRRKVSALVSDSTRYGALALSFICLLAFAFGHEIITLLFSAQYQRSVLPFAVLMLAISLMMIETTLGTTLAAIGESDKPLLINIVRTTLQIIAYLTLIPLLGVMGAALAATVAAAAVLPVNVYFLRRRSIAVNVRGYVKPMLISVALALMLWLLSPVSPVTAVCIALAYLPAALFFSVVTVGELTSAAAWAYSSRRSGQPIAPQVQHGSNPTPVSGPLLPKAETRAGIGL